MDFYLTFATKTRALFFVFVLINFLKLNNCNFLNVGGQTSPGTVAGKTAKLEIDNAVSSISTLSVVSSLTTSGISSGSCAGPPNTTTITDTESVLNDSFQEGYQNRQINVESNPGAIFQIQGTIDSNSDIDFFYVFSTNPHLFDFSLNSGNATCKLFIDGIENSNNTSTPGDGNTFTAALNSFPITGNRTAIGPGFNIDEEIYFGCSGTSGNTYSLLLKNSSHTIVTSQGQSASQNSSFVPSYIAPQVFEKEIGGIESSKIYTRQSVDDCISKIRSEGTFSVLSNTHSYIQSIQCGYPYIAIDPIVVMAKFCKLEEAHTLQFGNSGIF